MLTEAQVKHYFEHGYVVAPRLIPQELAYRADAAAWLCNKLDKDFPERWHTAPENEFFDAPDLTACYTSEYLACAAQLCDDPYTFPQCRPPENAFVIKLLPDRTRPWEVRNRHIDGAGAAARARVFPAVWKLFSMIYLHDVAPHGGGTVVWPGTHRVAEAIARSDPQRFRYLFQVAEAMEARDPGPHLELTPKAGDVLYMHPLLSHAKPMNTGPRPRFAIHTKW